MLFYTLSAFCVAACGLFATGEPTLPVTICQRNSVDYHDCLKRAIIEAWPRFIAGLPEFDFPPLDPIFYAHDKVVYNQGEIRGELIMTNITDIGLAEARFFDVRTHFHNDAFRLEIDAAIPKLYIEGGVFLNGSVSVFRVTGKGHFNISVEDVRATWDISGPVINDTWTIDHFRVAPSIGTFKIYFDNLVEQSQEINDVVVNFVNEFWPALYRVMLPLTAEVWDPWLCKFPNKIFSKIPFSKIFP